MIEVDHLVRACEGDPEKISGLMVLLAMASFCLQRTDTQACPPSVQTQLDIFKRGTEALEQQLMRLIP